MKEDKGTIHRKKSTMQRRGNQKKKKRVTMGIAGRKKKKDLGKLCMPHTMTYTRYMMNELDGGLVLNICLQISPLNEGDER